MVPRNCEGVALDRVPVSVFKPLYDAWMTDLSIDGMGLLVTRPLPANTRCWVRLDELAGRPLIMPLRLIYCRQMLKHTYRIGAAFRFDR